MHLNLAKDGGGYVDPDGNGSWWIPSGRVFLSAGAADSAATELARASQHFFLPRRYRDPFAKTAFVDFDVYDLLMVESRDALGNRVTVEANDYRVLGPRAISDPNRNRAEVKFDVLGMVAGTAVMGKPAPAPAEGDSLQGFATDLTQSQIDDFFGQPRQAGSSGTTEAAPIVYTLLGNATTRIVYDLDRYRHLGE